MEKALKFALWTIGIFALIAGIGRAFLFETWEVPHDPVLATSLAPTLRGGDLVLVLTVGEVKFGDLAQCTDPEYPEEYVVGRVMGLPGDVVTVKGSSLQINGSNYNAQEACVDSLIEVDHPDTGAPMPIRCSRVEVGNNWHFRGNAEKYMAGNDFEHSTSAGYYFLLSDNRDFHDDSRDYGEIPVENCTKRPFFRLWGKEGWMDSDARLTFIR